MWRTQKKAALGAPQLPCRAAAFCLAVRFPASSSGGAIQCELPAHPGLTVDKVLLAVEISQSYGWLLRPTAV